MTDETSVYEAPHQKPPETLDEMRVVNPQGTIDYLFGRKEFYKDLSVKYNQQFKLMMAKLRGLSKELDYEKAQATLNRKLALKWKHKSERETSMKQWWKIACCTLAVGFITLITSVFIASQMMSATRQMDIKVPTSGAVINTPPRILASVNIMNGEKQGSGTVISKGSHSAYVLTVAHNFKGIIGGPFWVYYPDGSYAKGTLLAIDRERDLALGKVDVDTILAHSYVPEELILGSVLSGCGYTGGQGPNYRTLVCEESYRTENNRWLWQLRVESGPFWSGDSGSGVFIDDACIGVTSLRSTADPKKLYAVPLNDVVAFLKQNATDYEGCGDWRIQPPVTVTNSEQPPIWSPRPNVPLNISNKAIKDLQLEISVIKDKIGLIPRRNELMKRPSEIKE